MALRGFDKTIALTFRDRDHQAGDMKRRDGEKKKQRRDGTADTSITSLRTKYPPQTIKGSFAIAG
ncbi:hypothetical protein EJF18_60065 [Clavispora lusitaniae]|uniref:Uncharacterized protein n=1 Tax=Clavispora lusitaniae TaxID=36911 RepID=A0ACD0WQK7_CLALS|nr:hypothetical protein EJF14_60065 [Clavispora lusitaniae]QFZ35205.1 hypothetical protein EJF16_60065 [Clavispora lusitaniae]QFZ40899.1 hypothetical protein EJF15_60065 [Clavispora lusitaniae]QFZ46580.1 hypothetical protein EJF18_60065 [Clavispora lusitaniae]QFZ52245.1 hypothetical protein EJF17_60065 [Clavispora lusitaniae]